MHGADELSIAGVANMRLGSNAGIISPIDFSTPTGRACINPTRPNRTSANPMRGCPTESSRCGDGCIPTGAQCCGAVAGDTTSYCDSQAGGACRVAVPCAGSQNCCSPSDTFGSNDCGPSERQCGLQCVSRDRPCCPVGSTDPACGPRPFAGIGVGVAVEAPRAPTGGGGGGGGLGGFGDTCGYAGNYKGVFKCAARVGAQEVLGQLAATFVLQHNVTVAGLATLDIVSVQIDDPGFGATSAIAPVANASLAALPCTSLMSGEGFLVTLPNGGSLAMQNGANALSVSADLRSFSNTSNPAYVDETWTAGTGRGDSNAAGSGPGGYAYNSIRWLSWTITKQ